MKFIIIFSILFLQFFSFAYAAPAKRQSADLSKRKGPAISTETVKLSLERPEYCLFGGQTGNDFYGAANFMMTIWKNRIIYLGESGGRQDFTAQRDTLKAMNMAKGNKIAVAFGAMNKEIQPLLDIYMAGEMDQEEFFTALSGREDTNYDITQYKQILDMIKEKGLKALAIGLPAALVDAVDEYGEEGLSQEEKRLIPLTFTDPHNTNYEKYVKKKLEEVSGEKITPTALKRHIHALSVLNETMAKSVADFILANPDYSMLVILDNDRIVYASGITLSIKNYLSSNSQEEGNATDTSVSISTATTTASTPSIPYTTIFIKHSTSCPKRLPEADRNLGGYVWYMDNSPLPEKTEEPAPAKADTEKK